MSNRVIVLWSLWIGLMVALFALVYLASPLGAYGIMWMSFVSMPLYFAAGAELKDMASFSATNCLGIVWGLFYLLLIGIFSGWGLSGPWATACTIMIATPSCCIFHMLIPDKFLFNKLAAAFGAIACTFSTNGEMLIPVALTLICGVVVGFLCKFGLRFFLKPEVTK